MVKSYYCLALFLVQCIIRSSVADVLPTQAFYREGSLTLDDEGVEQSPFNGTIRMMGPLSMEPNAKFAVLGTGIYRAHKMFVRWINEQKGGIKVGDLTYGLQLDLMNDMSDSARVSAAVKKAIADNVDFIMAPYSSGLTGVAAALTHEANKLIIAPGAASAGVFIDRPLVYGTLPRTALYMDSAVEAMAALGAKNITYFHEPASFNKDVCGAIPALAEKYGVTLLEEPPVEISATATEEELDGLVEHLRSLNVDGVFGCTYYDICTKTIQAMKRADYVPAGMVFTACVQDELAIDLGTDAQYVMGVTPWTSTLAVTDSLTGWTATEFNDMYTSEYGFAPPYQTASAFTIFSLLIMGIEEAGSLDPFEVADAMSNNIRATVGGTIQFDENGQNMQPLLTLQVTRELDVSTVVAPAVYAMTNITWPLPTWSWRECDNTHGCNTNGDCQDDGTCVCHTGFAGDLCEIDLSTWKPDPCTTENFVYVVSDCDAGSESRKVTFSWIEPKECGGGLPLPDDTTLDCDMVPSDSATGSLVIALAIVGAVTAVAFLLFVQLNKSKPVIKSAQRSLCLLFCLGAAMTCLSLLSFLGDNTDSNCVQRPWLFHISVTIMFGALFVKVYRVWRVFDNPSLKTRHLTLGAMYKKLAMLVCVDLVILLVWTLASPSEAVVNVEDEPGIGPVTHTECETESSSLVTVMFMWKICLILVGCFMSYKTRNVDKQFSESHHIFLAIYNIAFVGGLTMLVTNMMDSNVKSTITLQAIGTVWCSVVSLGAVFIPKALMLNKSASEISPTTSSGTNKTAVSTKG